MTDLKELDRLDRLVAEKMGWKRKRTAYKGISVWVDDTGKVRRSFENWSPTRNSADRDILDDWVVEKGYRTELLHTRLAGVSFLYRINSVGGPNGFVVGKADARGEAVCRAVEKMMEVK